MINFKHRGDFKNTERLFDYVLHHDYKSIIRSYGEKGVTALKNATPVRSGKTADSWYYIIEEGRGYIKIIWCNSNVNKGENIAVLIQYGHGTRNGGYVMPTDYINPAMKPIFEEIADKAWKEVVS